MPIPSEAAVRPVLDEIREPVVSAIQEAWGDWLASGHNGVWRCKRSRANFVWEQIILRYVTLYNQQLPQSALASRTPLQAMKDWHKLRPALFKKKPYYLTGCDTYPV